MRNPILVLAVLVGCGRTGLDVPSSPPAPSPPVVEVDRVVAVDVGVRGLCTRSRLGRVACEPSPLGDVRAPFVLVESGALAVSAGGMGVWSQSVSACALLVGGKIVCAQGIAGDDSSEHWEQQVDGAVAITVGYQTACVLLGDGRVRCSSGSAFAGPMRNVEWFGGAASLSCGYASCCAVMRDGSVRCATLNEVTSGNGEVSVVALPGRATSVSAGMWHACATTEDGAVVCWGTEAELLTPAGHGVVSAGVQGTCVLDAAGQVSCTSNGETRVALEAVVQMDVGFGDVCGVDVAGVVGCAH